MASDTTTLAPCPFCGGCAVHFHYSGSACVGCKDCIAYLGGEESDLKPDALAEAWNRRAPTPVAEDAANWHWLASYLVGPRTDLDDEIVASESVNDLRKLVSAARARAQAAQPEGGA